MYYSAIGLLAAMILLIENRDILLNLNGAFDKPAWRVYRCFLFTVLVYYFADILWGFLESRKLSTLLFINTSVYFIVMAVGILFWTQYVIIYLEEKNSFGRLFVYTGHFIAASVTILAIVNIFYPVLFTVDKNCVYTPLFVRYIVLIIQIFLLVVISIYAFLSIFRKKDEKKERKYRTIAMFGAIMAFFLTVQIWFPYLPLYGIAFMLGTCLLRAVIIGDEKEDYRSELIEAEKIKVLKQSISSLLDNMPALSFSKDAETGVYLACNQAFAEYAHKESPEGVIGLTDAQIFDPVTAGHFVQDDKMALSMDEPYIFFEDVPDAAGNQRQFQTTKLKFIDDAGRMCTLGMCQDVTDMVRIQREHATTKEAYEKARSSGVIFTHIAQTLARGYRDLYYVNMETGEYIEYHTEEEKGTLSKVRSGHDFFESAKRDINTFIYQDDRDNVEKALEKETLIETLGKNKNFNMVYRLASDKEPRYVSMQLTRMEDDERFIVIGMTDVDEEMKQRNAAERINEERIAYARINALAGDFLCVYVVEPETGRYREFSSTEGFKMFDMPKEGSDFFSLARGSINDVIYPADLDRFLSIFNREEILSEIKNNGIFSLSYRILVNGKPNYVQLKAAIVEEKEGKRLVVGVNDIELHVRQEEDYARRLAQAQNKANIDALTGVKNKYAYQEKEERLNRQIREHRKPKFAIVIMDINDLKKVNDTEGHQAGDQYIRDACKIICDIFKHSPVFRVGGDEFAVIAQGNDYSCIEELIDRVGEHNEEASQSGGVVIACGMSRFSDDDSVNQVFERADQNMYKNKSRLKTENNRG